MLNKIYALILFCCLVFLIGILVFLDFIVNNTMPLWVYYLLLTILLFFLFITYRHKNLKKQLSLKKTILEKNEALEKALKITEKALQAKGCFLANMSHELRTPLNAILGFSGAMQQEIFGPLDKKYQEYIQNIHTSGIHLLSLIDDILDLSKLEANKETPHFEWVNIYELLKDISKIIAGYKEASKRNILINCAENLPPLWADPQMVRRILLNILSNAIKFTKENGKITVQVLISKKSEYFIEIKDNGIGIPKDKIDYVKMPFTQIEENFLEKTHRGSGLGLAVVNKLMQLHKGHFNIESQLKKGTKIELIFPAPTPKKRKKKND